MVIDWLIKKLGGYTHIEYEAMILEVDTQKEMRLQERSNYIVENEALKATNQQLLSAVHQTAIESAVARQKREPIQITRVPWAIQRRRLEQDDFNKAQATRHQGVGREEN